MRRALPDFCLCSMNSTPFRTSLRLLPGVAHGFLGALTSRNSDFQGYWLFGYLVPLVVARPLEVDLLGKAPVRRSFSSAEAVLRFRAVLCWEHAARGHRLHPVRIASAKIVLTSLGRRACWVGAVASEGQEMRCELRVECVIGRRWSWSQDLCVVPHPAPGARRSVRRWP